MRLLLIALVATAFAVPAAAADMQIDNARSIDIAVSGSIREAAPKMTGQFLTLM
jgi:hypothetical protein